MQKMNNRRLGEEKERFVCEWLEGQGYRILERNFRCRTGEIDIVAQEGGYLVFIEVKYRAAGGSGTAQAADDFTDGAFLSEALSVCGDDTGAL